VPAYAGFYFLFVSKTKKGQAEMNNLIKDRVKLIRSMQKAAEGNGNSDSFLKAIETVRKDENGHFLSCSQEMPGQVSYSEKPECRLDNGRRVRTTLGRYFRRQLRISHDEIEDKTLLEITREISARLSEGSKSVRIISGSKIVDAYSKSYGGASCMTGENSDKTQLYADNPKIVSMVVYGNGEARALLWRTEQGATVMDRIYPNDGPHVNALWNWAEKRGYVWRRNNSLPDGTVELSDDKFHTVALQHNHFFPYMDTFCYGKISGGKIILSNDSCCAEIILQDTNGDYSNARTCHACGDLISYDDSFNGADDNCYCEECFNERFRNCDRCDTIIYIEDCQTVDGSERWCPSCRDEYAYSCANCDEWHTETVAAEDTGEHFCKDCASEKLRRCDVCGFSFESELCVGSDEKLRCEECNNKYESDKLEAAA
jgi:hypothetical protein